MTRTVGFIDRMVALLVGVALIALGAAMLVWNSGWIATAPHVITAPALRTATTTTWWPWALAAAGIVMVAGAVWFLLIHTPDTGAKGLRLPSTELGALTVDLSEVAAAAARTLEQVPEVQSARGKVVLDRGVRMVDLTVIATAATDLASLPESIDVVCSQIATMLADPTVATRTVIRIAKVERRVR